MPLLNYTTKVPVERTLSQIQGILVKAGARAVLMDYDAKGEVTAMSFKLQMPAGQLMAFRLPVRVDDVLRILTGDQDLPPSKQTREHAARVAWRILKDWVEAQLAFSRSGQSTLPELFLSFAEGSGGQTFYEQLIDKQHRIDTETGESIHEA
jgi:hypothetical protein